MQTLYCWVRCTWGCVGTTSSSSWLVRCMEFVCFEPAYIIYMRTSAQNILLNSLVCQTCFAGVALAWLQSNDAAERKLPSCQQQKVSLRKRTPSLLYYMCPRMMPQHVRWFSLGITAETSLASKACSERWFKIILDSHWVHHPFDTDSQDT